MNYLSNYLAKHPLRVFLLITLGGLVTAAALQFLFFENWEAIKSDGFGNYIYLPNLVIDGSLDQAPALARYLDVSPEQLPAELNGVYERTETGSYLSKYPFGVALLQMPFFLLAHLLALLLPGQAFAETGFSFVYQLASQVSALVFYTLAIVATYKLLVKRFSWQVTLFTLSLLFLGSNVIHYATYDSSFSHMYSWALISWLLVVVDRRKFHESWRDWLVIALLVGLIALVRNTNLVVALIPGVVLLREAIQRWKSNPASTKIIWLNFLKRALAAIIVSGLVLLPLLLYWRITAGSFLINSYDQEGFDFLRPEFSSVMFSVYNGLFFWHPLLLLSIPGFFIAFRKRDSLTCLGALVLLATLYIISSWWAWWFGFSFGHRGFTDYYAIFALGWGYFFSISWGWVRDLGNDWVKRLVIAVATLILGFLLLLNLIQMNNYWRNIVSGNNLSPERYQEFFFRPCWPVSIQQFRCD